MPELAVSADFDAPPERVWAVVTDWAAQSRWVPFTRATGGTGEGARVEAWTGIGPVGFLDPMEITLWDPPRRCTVRHLGRVVRGTAVFEVEPLPGGRSRFTWAEWVDLPVGGMAGELGYALVAPFVRAGLRAGMRRLGDLVSDPGTRAAA